MLRQLQPSRRTATLPLSRRTGRRQPHRHTAAGRNTHGAQLRLALFTRFAYSRGEQAASLRFAHAQRLIHTFFLVALSHQAGAGMAGPVSPGGPASSLPLESSALEAAWPGTSPQCTSMNSMYSLLLSIRGPRMRTRSSEPMTSFSRSAWCHRKGHGRGVQPRRSAKLLQASRVRAALRAPRRARGALPCAPRAG